ncbi:hypothetical protein LINPERHAP1_LOCUS10772, partial [Linum perenne]
MSYLNGPPSPRRDWYPTADEVEATIPDTRGMGVIPMCDCGLTAKVKAVYPTFHQKDTKYKHFLGCPKESGRCRMVMWCEMKDRNMVEDKEISEVYDELVVLNMELESHVEVLGDQVEGLQ